MPDLALTAPPPRAQLLLQLRARLGEIAPSLRVVAEGVLGAETPIDFVGVESSGRVALVLVGDAGEDLTLVGRALAQRRWVEARVRDWLKLAPGLGIRPEAGVRVVLLCPRFQPETLAAGRALGSAVVELAQYRCVRNGAGVETLVEALDAPAPAAPRSAPPQPMDSPPPFRTGLTDTDLGLTAEEHREFDPDPVPPPPRFPHGEPR